MSLGNSVIALVIRNRIDDSKDHTNHDAQKCQATDALVPASVDLIDNRKGGEKHI